ncbi:hypothetical protein H5410_023698 [Solanum commersonii]|uniref:Uncharacterized protein n=1 Tax=Solanum commersonii TaxID=4109 RepID=A0A9J5ZHJ9_SOLCO|nr:hypothetical protein H5410_023698 [Solanum commersonii]
MNFIVDIGNSSFSRRLSAQPHDSDVLLFPYCFTLLYNLSVVIVDAFAGPVNLSLPCYRSQILLTLESAYFDFDLTCVVAYVEEL